MKNSDRLESRSIIVKTDLTDEEKETIIEALNNNIEPPPELMTKLFPGLF